MTRSQLLVSTETKHARSGADHPRYCLLVANENDEVVAAQRLRYQVFAREMGATVASGHPGLDVDYFDQFCDHLVVREEDSGEIVGTYRMLPPHRAHEAGMLYADAEFDLTSLAGVRDSLVETGRSCVHPEHRDGAVVGLVWAGIARYMLLSGYRYVAGCASVPLDDGGSYAAGVWDLLHARNYVQQPDQVCPLRAWACDGIERPTRPVFPALLKGYLRLGARVCGPPAYDPEFGVADFFVLLDVQRIEPRYLNFLLGTG